ncbi:sodium-dependent phosphate transporter 2 isoform X3 [Bicyclus anynana]|uniref:Phosphate transporter n=1 Tax=Bicyclus anynana TaxID=110368 RepID=A0ABM3M7C3_BICAN|nr:sodium-dependent phosphate transporter 2 isoform X3 [Bicyclus anynana]
MEPYSDELLWLVICGFVVAFVLAFGIGANDVANSFGTSVGSKVLTLTQACILATIFEIAGAVLIGYKVSDTMRKGILDVTLYDDGGERLLAAGCLAALIAGAAWLIIATALRLPVSGTHSVVGATVGFTLVAKGPIGIRWSTLGAIVLSWFISPALSGTVSAVLYWFVRRFILRASQPLAAGLKALPFFYGATIAVNVVSVVLDGPKLLAMDNIPLWMALSGSVAVGALGAIGVCAFLVPYYKRRFVPPPVNFTLGLSNGDSCDTIARGELGRLSTMKMPIAVEFDTPPPRSDKGPEGSAWSIECEIRNTRLAAITPNSSAAPLLRSSSPAPPVAPPPPPPDALRLFSFLQVLTATFGAFAHGGNDVSNAIGPLVALWLLYTEGGAHARAETPLAILVFGGVGIALGLWLWGRRVIRTVGEDLTSITPDTGFTIELGAALTVLIASKAGLPISTTHCKVGSVVCVGYFSEKSVDWSLFRNIIFAWVVTVPAVAATAALAMLALEAFVV